MKKIYQNPEIKVVEVQVSPLMAGSPGYGGSTDAVSGNAARQFGGDFYDDDEEEDEY